MLTPFTTEHAGAVASLHCATLTGLLTRLGPRVAVAVYRGYAASEHCRGFVAWEDGVRGFVLGSERPAALRRDGLHRFEVATAIAARSATRPSVLRDLRDAQRGPAGDGFDLECPELTYIAVAPTARGQGLGATLMAAFEEALRERGVTAYDLSVDADNSGAVRFYERRGFRRVASYRQFGIDHHRYRVELVAPGSAGPNGDG